MSVIWQINLEHQPDDPLSVERCAFSIISEYMKTSDCRPKVIHLAANGIGAAVGEILELEKLPVKIISPAHWRQMVPPELDGPTEIGQLCL